MREFRSFPLGTLETASQHEAVRKEGIFMPEEHPEIRRFTIQEVCTRLEHGDPLFLLDVRRIPDSTQIKGATYWPPLELLAADRIKLPVSQDALIVPYCDEPQERLSAQVARKLMDQGYENVHPLLGGYVTWKRRRIGYPIERRPGARTGIAPVTLT